ncbi:MAG TPA: metalloregulator ArsR/SmtB family transcription factor [Ktedonobacteraceae bacterium]|nr:metalloregulator ArsR/SmtB family transcription factor [Ktedonobacteraceae bacterium]
MMHTSRTVQRTNIDVFTAIAHPVRRRILDVLAYGEQSVNSLAAPFALTRPAISQHLRVLLEAGLVSIHQKGREHWYQLQPDHLQEVQEWLCQYERFWNQKLQTLETYLAAFPGEDEAAPPSVS